MGEYAEYEIMRQYGIDISDGCSGEEKPRCPYCGKRFGVQKDIELHMKDHHKNYARNQAKKQVRPSPQKED